MPTWYCRNNMTEDAERGVFMRGLVKHDPACAWGPDLGVIGHAANVVTPGDRAWLWCPDRAGRFRIDRDGPLSDVIDS